MTTEVAQLTVYLEERMVQTVALSGPLLAIGRTPDNGLALPHPLVARRHAEIRLGDGVAMLTDLGSTTGTFVDGERLLADQPRQLADGSVVRVGPFSLLYRGAQAAAAEPPAEGEPAEAVPPAAPPAQLPTVPPPTARPRLPALRASGPASRYLRDLPVVYQTNEFMGRFLQIFESIWEPLEQRQDHVDMYFDPRTCPAEFLPWLASWLDLSIDAEWPEPRKRAILSEAFDLYRWRGTRYGLSRIIELSTGLTPEIVDEPAIPFVMRIRLTLPGGAALDRQAIEEVIQAHKPAHVGYILELR
jgi:phage tail-like protein